ncbi:hypothetical protein NLG97_g3533 [Lecanicillium saksenae]|uniref:Uncharacterized protein n=1 Tax=Lecanicillium saksenae TaxID=468837 RepID=A0ACC1R133_9HYPO|nr:hypothetical protein NLG97_g3533 [Lecanicillium saksenae]
MELAAGAATTGVSGEPQTRLQAAIQEFQNILTEDQRGKLGKIGASREAETVMIFTAQLDRKNQLKRGRGIASRLHAVLQSVQSFTTVVETFVSSHPEIAALIWGSVKLTLLIAVNFTSHFEALSAVFMSFSKQCPRFAEYQALYPASTGLQRALCDFHASIIRCCKHAVEIIQRPWQQKLKKAILQSFEQELQSDVKDIHHLGKEVKAEITLAAANAERQDQKLQALERESAAKSRSSLRSFIPRVEREERLRLLQWVSSYDRLTPFREACVGMKEMTHLYYGALEKLALAKLFYGHSHVVNHIFQNMGLNDRVSFFFVTHDNAESLRAETVIRSVIRQSLNSETLSKDIEKQLTDLNEIIYIDLKSWVSLLQYVIQNSGVYFVFLDGLDECSAVERLAILDALELLTNSASNLRIFITSRDNLRLDLRGRSITMQHVSMACDSLTRDIRSYINTSVQERLQQNELVLGDPHLSDEIINTLTKHADGMFLWVTFLLNEICTGSCDADIRNALKGLPWSLEEAYTRIISRLASLTGRTRLIQRVFRLVAAAKRPMTLDELQECVSIEIGQKNRKEDLLTPDMSRVVLWSENILQIAEEEPRQVRFAHSSIYDFITKKASSQLLSNFYVDINEANHLLGELCVTYLNFNEFKKTMTRRQQPVHLHPVDIASTALSRELKLTKLTPVSNAFRNFVSKNRKGITDLARAAENHGAATTLEMENIRYGYPFLEYAAAYWTFHTVEFQKEKSRTWNIFLHIVEDDSIPANRPWQSQMYGGALLRWGQETCHRPLFHHVISGVKIYEHSLGLALLKAAAAGDDELVAIALPIMIPFFDITPGPGVSKTPAYMLAYALEAASRNGHIKVVELLLKTGLDLDNAAALLAASEDGQVEVVELVLNYNVYVDDIVSADSNVLLCPGIERRIRNTLWSEARMGRTALQAACRYGQIEVVERLLAANADVNAAASLKAGQTALQAACNYGQREVVGRLLVADADVNAAAGPLDGPTALQLACQYGDIEVVERLIAANADVNATSTSWRGVTALEAASREAHIEVVERLISANADVNATSTSLGGTALEAACREGHIEVVERLISANADVNATSTSWRGVTALQAACDSGIPEIVELLIIAGADVHADPGVVQAALSLACHGRHPGLVVRLLAAGVDVDTVLDGGDTALWMACEDGHFKLVQILLAAGADFNVPGKDGITPFQVATQQGHHEIIQLLMKAGAKL